MELLKDPPTQFAEIGRLVGRLVNDDPDEFATWIRDVGPSWVKTRVPALAAVVEAAHILNLPGILEHMVEILRDEEADPLTASIAAQRIRHAQVPEDARLEVAELLWRCIRIWEPPRSIHAAGSFPHFALPERGTDVVSLLSGQAVVLSLGVVYGVIDLAYRAPDRMEGVRGEITEALLRLGGESADHDLVPAALWCLGSVCDQDHLDEVCRTLAAAFAEHQGLRDGASVRGGRLLVQRFPEAAEKLLAALPREHERWQGLLRNLPA